MFAEVRVKAKVRHRPRDGRGLELKIGLGLWAGLVLLSVLLAIESSLWEQLA